MDEILSAADLRSYFDFRCIEDSDRLEESYRLRHEVYCLERGFLAADEYPDGREIDEYDPHSLHFGAFNRNDFMVGTIRLVGESNEGYPLQSHCELDLDAFPPNTAEISRLAVSKTYRRRADDDIHGISRSHLTRSEDDSDDRRRRPEIVLGLYRAMYQESKRRGIEFWLAAMERSLVRLLWRYSFTFEAVGPEVDYYGPVTPYLARISDIERNVLAYRPSLYREFTAGL